MRSPTPSRTGTPADLKEELGDLLLQVVYYAQMAAEEDRFTFDAVAHTIADKMIARHPHVFGDESVRTAAEMTDRWEAQKAAERAAKATADGGTGAPASVLDGVPLALPGLTRAAKLQRRAARVGFDWRTAAPIFDKIAEEQAELAAALAVPPGAAPARGRAKRRGDGGAGRSAVLRGQSRAPSGDRPGTGAAARHRQVRPGGSAGWKRRCTPTDERPRTPIWTN